MHLLLEEKVRNNQFEPRSNPKMILIWVVIAMLVLGVAAAYLFLTAQKDSVVEPEAPEKGIKAVSSSPTKSTVAGKVTHVIDINSEKSAGKTSSALKTEDKTSKGQKVIISNKTMTISPKVKDAVLSKQNNQ